MKNKCLNFFCLSTIIKKIRNRKEVQNNEIDTINEKKEISEIEYKDLELEEQEIMINYGINLIGYLRNLNQNIEVKYSRLLNVILTLTGLIITALGIILSFRTYYHLDIKIIYFLITFSIILTVLFCILIFAISPKLFTKKGSIIDFSEYKKEISEANGDVSCSTLESIEETYEIEYEHNKKISKNKKCIKIVYVMYTCLSVIFFLIVALLSKS